MRTCTIVVQNGYLNTLKENGIKLEQLWKGNLPKSGSKHAVSSNMCNSQYSFMVHIKNMTRGIKIVEKIYNTEEKEREMTDKEHMYVEKLNV
jgi:hypothetical protein